MKIKDELKNNSMLVYHSTSDPNLVDYFNNHDFKAGRKGGSMLGDGFYCNYQESQARKHNYGPYTFKAELENWDKILILSYQMYKLIYPTSKHTPQTFLDDQLQQFGVSLKGLDSYRNHSSVNKAREFYTQLQNNRKIWGVGYYGNYDGMSFVLWKPRFMVKPLAIAKGSGEFTAISSAVDLKRVDAFHEDLATLKMKYASDSKILSRVRQLSKIKSKKVFERRQALAIKMFPDLEKEIKEIKQVGPKTPKTKEVVDKRVELLKGKIVGIKGHPSHFYDIMKYAFTRTSVNAIKLWQKAVDDVIKEDNVADLYKELWVDYSAAVISLLEVVSFLGESYQRGDYKINKENAPFIYEVKVTGSVGRYFELHFNPQSKHRVPFIRYPQSQEHTEVGSIIRSIADKFNVFYNNYR